MAKFKQNATRVGILLAIAGIIFSSAGLTLVLLMQSNNSDPAQSDQAKLQQQIQEQLKQQKEASVPKEPLPGYEATPFDGGSVTALKVETLKEGDGPAATKDSTVTANYFGWTADGKIFDSNKNVDFPLSGVIQGWTDGLTGVKQGSVVRLTIPAEQAYGVTDNGDGRPFGPLAFIVELTAVK